MIINDEAISIFAKGRRCIARGDDDGLSAASYELAVALRLRPWCTCPFDCIGANEPLSWETGEFALTDWRRSNALADQLEQALRERRRAARKGLPPAA